jgi:hypothetical protein
MLNRNIEAIAFEGYDAKQTEGAAVVWILGQDLPAERFRLCQPPRLIVRERDLKISIGVQRWHRLPRFISSSIRSRFSPCAPPEYVAAVAADGRESYAIS